MTINSLSHLSPETKDFLADSDEQRIARILSERFICYPRAQEVLDHVEFLAFHPPQTRAWGLGVVAPPGSGKTMLAKAVVRRLARNAADHPHDRKQVMPTVYISMTGAREARTIDARILESLGCPFNRATLGVAERELLVRKLLRDAEVKLLLIDEIQDVLTSTERQQRFALDHIKLLMNTLSIPVVVLGVPGAIEAMTVDAHLAARFDWKTLPTWQFDEDSRDLLDALESTTPLRHASHLSSPDRAKLLLRKSAGNLARLVRLVNNSAVLAVAEKTERITDDQIERSAVGVPMRPRWEETHDSHP